MECRDENLDKIYKIVCEHFRTNISKKTRKREVVEMRAMFYALSREMTYESLASIGDMVNKQHCSVLHGLSFHERIMCPGPAGDQRYRKRYDRLRRIVRSVILDVEDQEEQDQEESDEVTALRVKCAELQDKIKTGSVVMGQEKELVKLFRQLDPVKREHAITNIATMVKVQQSFKTKQCANY